MSTEVLEQESPASIPHPPGRIPILGDVRNSSPRRPIQDVMRFGKQLGPIFERKIFGRRIVFVSGADMVAELSDEARFAKYLSPAVARLRQIGGDGLFTAYNDEPNWRKAHNLLRPAFTQAAMRSYHQIMVDVARELVADWDTRTTVDVSADMTKLTLETIGRTGFSHPFDSFRRERLHPFVEAMVGALRHAQLRTFLSPPLVGELLWRRADKRNLDRIAFMNGVVDEVIRERREVGHTGPDDLLELMMRAARDDDPDRIDDVNIRHQVLTFLVAGHETTSGALSFAFYYLSQHPEILAKAQAEVDEVWGPDTGADPSFEQIAKLRHVRRVLDEALRMWPTAPIYGREAREDTTLVGRYPMRAGDGVLVSIPSLHRDPAWGPDADVFDPDRFLPARVKARPAHIYKPFGTGERACIGRQFALHEAVLVLGTILRRYDLEPDADYQLRVQERLTVMPDGFRLNLRRRRRS
ncbi:cytochrome P450 [Antrihabitans spumae]|uniref:Cytochrome P450 n=1 Tax=Antrihabitans spumae TaxID=3373370 RepID=A0ABW7K1U6_9NOCA